MGSEMCIRDSGLTGTRRQSVSLGSVWRAPETNKTDSRPSREAIGLRVQSETAPQPWTHRSDYPPADQTIAAQARSKLRVRANDRAVATSRPPWLVLSTPEGPKGPTTSETAHRGDQPHHEAWRAQRGTTCNNRIEELWTTQIEHRRSNTLEPSHKNFEASQQACDPNPRASERSPKTLKPNPKTSKPSHLTNL